jgi:hypothetical protein
VTASEPERLILHIPLSPGDVLTATAAVESLHAAYPGRYATAIRCPVPDIWEHNPHVSEIADADGRGLTLQYPLIQRCNQTLLHFLHGYTQNLGDQLGISLMLSTNRPHLYLSDDEKKWRNQIGDVWEQQLAGRSIPFWIVNAGVKNDFTAKQWPVESYQEVVNATRGRIQWVQIGEKSHDHPDLGGVLDLRGKTDQRQLIRLTYHAQGGMGPVTYLQHLMAAWEKPYLCLLGGREPIQWVQYPRQTTFHSFGSSLACCKGGACWKSRVVPFGDAADEKNKSLCDHPVLGGLRPVAKCMAMIRPGEVLDVLERLL